MSNTALYSQDRCDFSCEECMNKDRDLQEIQNKLTKLHAKLAINQSQWIQTMEAIPME